MLTYVTNVMFPEDDDAERARRVEIYAAQMELADAADPEGAALFRMGPYARPVRCVELDREFPSVRDAAKFAGVRRSHLKNAIRSSGGRCAGLTFEYVAGAYQRVRTGRERRVRCVTDDVTFDSLQEAKAYGGVASSTLCGALRESRASSPAKCAGKLWEYVDERGDREDFHVRRADEGRRHYIADRLGQMLFGFDEPPRRDPYPRVRRTPRTPGPAQYYLWN